MEKTKTELLADEILLKAKTELTGNIHSLIRAINTLEFIPTNEEDIFTALFTGKYGGDIGCAPGGIKVIRYGNAAVKIGE